MRIDDTGSPKAAVAEAFSFRNRIFSVLSMLLSDYLQILLENFIFFL